MGKHLFASGRHWRLGGDRRSEARAGLADWPALTLSEAVRLLSRTLWAHRRRGRARAAFPEGCRDAPGDRKSGDGPEDTA